MNRSGARVKRKLPRGFEELVRLYPPRVIRDRVDYDNTQEVIDRLTSIPRLTVGQDRYLDTLATLLHAYEDEHAAIEITDLTPLASLKFLMGEHGLNTSDLGRLLGERSLGAKILSGGREISKAHIRKLAEHFGVSAATFL